jgi:hypothetical protein
MPHQKSSDYKETAVQYYLVEDKTLEEVCKIFTNSIENYFSMLKSRLKKLDGLTHAELKENITKTRRIIYEFSYKMGVLNEKMCKVYNLFYYND